MKKLLLITTLAMAVMAGAIEIKTVPGFNTSSFYIRAAEGEVTSLRYRKVNDKEFLPVYPPIYDGKKKEYRGSIVHLRENTRYELQAIGKDGKTISKVFRTRGGKLKVAKTIILDESNFNGNLKITDSGRADGYIRYTSRPGFVLKNDGSKPLIEVDKARFIIIEDLVMQGGHQHALTVYNSKNIHIANCEISGWGRRGVQRFDIDGKFYSDYGPQTPYKDCFNYDSAIELKWSNTVTVERCYIHDPYGTANSWFYSHPTGPCAMTVAKCKRVVIRYNDFAGSDKHRWNDAVEGPGNFHPAGGLGFDADVYGNYMAFSNDDGIELDGGQANVRCFHNKFEQVFCGVSVQGCMTGPGYVFENLIAYVSDIQGCGNQAIKTNADRAGKYAVSYLFNNTIYSPEETELKLQSSWPVVAENNVYAGVSTLAVLNNHTGRSESNIFTTHTDFAGKDDIFTGKQLFRSNKDGQFFVSGSSPAKASGKVIPGFTPQDKVDRGARPAGGNVLFPVRPLPFGTDTSELSFTGNDAVLQVNAVMNKKAKSPLPFKVRINEAFDWLKVTPMEGTLNPGETLTFKVSIDKKAAKANRFLRGVFFIRTNDGLSRPVSVYGMGITENITRPEVAKGKFVKFIDPADNAKFKTVSDKLADGGTCLDYSTDKDQKNNYILKTTDYSFDVPEDGYYSILLRVKSTFPRKAHNSVFLAIDGAKPVNTDLMTAQNGIWSWILCNRKNPCPNSVKLKKGRHTLTLAPRESLFLDLIAVTNDPAAFEIW